MILLRNKYDLVSNFEFKRLNFWRLLSRNLNKDDEIVDSSKFKTKKELYYYINKKLEYSRSQTKRLIK